MARFHAIDIAHPGGGSEVWNAVTDGPNGNGSCRAVMFVLECDASGIEWRVRGGTGNYLTGVFKTAGSPYVFSNERGVFESGGGNVLEVGTKGAACQVSGFIVYEVDDD